MRLGVLGPGCMWGPWGSWGWPTEVLNSVLSFASFEKTNSGMCAHFCESQKNNKENRKDEEAVAEEGDAEGGEVLLEK